MKKNINSVGDLILVHYEGQPAIYARIEAIEPDIKKDWYQVTLLLLTIPQQIITWTLREEYINGTTFTMGGNSIMLARVDAVPQKKGLGDAAKVGNKKTNDKTGKIIPFKSSPEKH